MYCLFFRVYAVIPVDVKFTGFTFVIILKPIYGAYIPMWSSVTVEWWYSVIWRRYLLGWKSNPWHHRHSVAVLALNVLPQVWAWPTHVWRCALIHIHIHKHRPIPSTTLRHSLSLRFSSSSIFVFCFLLFGACSMSKSLVSETATHSSAHGLFKFMNSMYVVTRTLWLVEMDRPSRPFWLHGPSRSRAS